jgi:hypothetical protein
MSRKKEEGYWEIEACAIELSIELMPIKFLSKSARLNPHGGQDPMIPSMGLSNAPISTTCPS